MFLLCCGLKAGRSSKPRQSSELPVAHTVLLSSVGRILEVSPCALPFVEGSDGVCFLGTGVVVGVPELRDEPWEIAGPSKQTVAAYDC